MNWKRIPDVTPDQLRLGDLISGDENREHVTPAQAAPSYFLEVRDVQVEKEQGGWVNVRVRYDRSPATALEWKWRPVIPVEGRRMPNHEPPPSLTIIRRLNP